jgi:DNA-binding transcriptional LysR family regulator
MRSKDLDPRRHSQAADKAAGSRLRLLDFDDLFLLKHLLEGNTIAATAKQLGLTQPAITQRVRKIERVFAEPILTKVGRHVKLTSEGRAICTKAADALGLMHEVTSEPEGAAVAVGAAPSVGQRWLWPALRDLRVSAPRVLYHCVIGSSDELVGLLDAGSIEACLTSMPPPRGSFGALHVGDDEYVLVASPSLAESLKEPGDLQRTLLLELDRSFPLLSRVDAAARPAMRFGDIWFLGTLANIAAAAQAGHGVAILPRSVVQAGVAAGKLATVLPSVDVTPETFRLLFRRDRGIESLIDLLIERLRAEAKG